MTSATDDLLEYAELEESVSDYLHITRGVTEFAQCRVMAGCFLRRWEKRAADFLPDLASILHGLEGAARTVVAANYIATALPRLMRDAALKKARSEQIGKAQPKQ